MYGFLTLPKFPVLLRKFIIGSSIAVILILIILGYLRYERQKKVDIWALVPENAVLVYESESIVRTWNRLQQNDIWNNLQQIEYFRRAKSRFEALDSALKKPGEIDRLLTARSFLLSMHNISSNDFDFSFYLDISTKESTRIALSLLEKFKASPELSSSSRTYLNQKITEINSDSGEEVFTYTIYKDFFVGSFTAFLIEDVIRNLKAQELQSFKTVNQGLFSLAKLENDDGNIYLNLNRIEQFFSVFGSDQFDKSLKVFSDIGNASFLDVRFQDDQVLANGFSLFDIAGSDYLSIFYEQEPDEFDLKNFIPVRTAWVFHQTFNDVKRWEKASTNYLQKHHPGHLKQRSAFETKYGVISSDIFKFFDGEIGLATLESVDLSNPDKLLFIKTRDLQAAYNQLNRLAESVSAQSEDTLYRESFAGISLTQLYIEEFPATLLGPYYNGFDDCFYAPVGDYIVFGNNIQVLKSLMNDISLENVWGKSISHNLFLEDAVKEANVNIFFDMSRYERKLRQSLSPPWQKAFQKHSEVLEKFDMLALQFSYIDEKFYTSFLLKYREAEVEKGEIPRYITLHSTELDTVLISKPYIVRNHYDNSLEVLVQDANYNLHLISREGNVLWKDSLGQTLVSDIQQIDFYNNGKLQYFVSTENGVHIIDREGNDVADFPLSPGEFQIRNASVIDYDKSKRYRFLLADEQGNLYMYNKNKSNLEGWQPRNLNYHLSSSPFHLRVRGRDYIVAIQENGIVNILNRSGDMYDGFPMDLKGIATNPFFYTIGSNFENTTFTTVLLEGEILQFNLLGEFLQRRQLYRPTKEAKFKLCIDPLERTYVIARQELNRMSLLDREGDLIFEKDYITSEDMDVQYYRFGAGSEIFAITDKVQEFTYLYDESGQLINFTPLESSQQVALLRMRPRTYHVYTVFQNTLSLQSFAN